MTRSAIKKRVDKEGRFISFFNQSTGFYVRSGVIDENGKDTGVDPFMASFPELVDIGIMGNCNHGRAGICLKSGVECYQNGLNVKKANMALEDFKRIIDECEGKTYQVALGGRGDPTDHENFGEILAYCRNKNIVPNFTTSGFELTDVQAELAKEHCGAVAVSWYNSEYTMGAMQLLLKKGVKTNVHFVLSSASIANASELLRQNKFEGVNAVIFLLHKPVGLGSESGVLSPGDLRVRMFFEEVDKSLGGNVKVGFDSCSVPGIINYCDSVDMLSVDTCEAARWSMYISADLVAYPCSFDEADGFDLRTGTIADAWQSSRFNLYREVFKKACPECNRKDECMGGCQILRQITLCEREERMV